ncbi:MULTISPECIES: SDR family NAD(P)-dependent oxidoreductase [Clostridium]|uniref:SDR family NAD(P)-dependent oxidoreductase n=1 Tax=Clostridium TaxID=1485 RepID=UPI00082475BA|nr:MULTISPECIES: SDR family NAD(P)-dependent oxidoreductase [Clostridium]PJI08230.1 short-chain dehydrogenase [Clostridium sp. CT7]
MKNLLITGGSRGLGRELINVYYANGYNVFTVVRKQEDGQKLSKEFANHFTPIVANLVDDNCIDIIKDILTRSINHLDILINNAGIPGRAYKIADVTSTEMKSLFDIHCLAIIRTTQATLNLLRNSQKPKIVNITSRLGSLSAMSSGEFDGREFSYSYRIAKASQNMLSICLKQEFKTCNINVISIHPGRMQTQSGSSDADSSPLKSAENIYKWVQNDNLNKEGTFTEPYERDWNW